MGRVKLIRKYPKEVNWLLKNGEFLSYNKIEEKIPLTKSLLHKLSKGEAGINERFWPDIIKFVNELRRL